MKVYRSLAEYEAGPAPSATIGTFDGVHLGHRKILGRLLELAHTQPDGEAVVVTFEPHPRLVLQSNDSAVRLLTTIDEKIERLEALGLDKLLVLPFTRTFAATPYDVFIEQVLVDTLHVRHVCVGYDHRFGVDRSGGLKELRELAPRFGYAVEEIPAHQIDDANVSSTQIRQALNFGDVPTANRLLGYRYLMAAEVVGGESRGRALGFPTANLHLPDQYKLVPALGVYGVAVRTSAGYFPGMMNIGYRPTFGDGGLTLEVHLIDFAGDLYGQVIQVEFIDRVRSEKKFPSAEALQAQLTDDRARCLALFQTLSLA